MITTSIATTLAIAAFVTQDNVPLKAAPKDSAAQQAVLTQGDLLEIRGQKLDYVQVYDHRRERAGFVHISQVKTTNLKTEDAPELLAVVRFIRDTPGSEALGISYASAYLKAAPANNNINSNNTSEVLVALGAMAERLANRASKPQSKYAADLTSAHLDAVKFLGVRMVGFERNGSMQLCYDGEAYKQVVAQPTTVELKAWAALGLTKHECVNPDFTPSQLLQYEQSRSAVLHSISSTQASQLSPMLQNRLHLRKAGVLSSLAYLQSRRNEDVSDMMREAITELAAVVKTELSESDAIDYAEAAVRTGAGRFAALTRAATKTVSLTIQTSVGEPGQTCVELFDAKASTKMKKCTFGIVWPQSFNASPNGQVATLSVQTQSTWRELWVMRRSGDQWVLDVLPPSSTGPDLGVLEFAGWVAGSEKILVAREALEKGRIKTSFEVLKVDTLMVDQRASTPSLLIAFTKWQDPTWKANTLSVR
jgi:hypothetical protein